MANEVRVLSDEEVWSLMVGLLGFRPAVRLLGWCVLWSFTGARRLVDAAGGEESPQRATAYRALADLRRVVAAVVAAEGGDPERVTLLTLREFAERVSALSASRRAPRAILAHSWGVFGRT